MRITGVTLIAWWIYVYTYVLAAPNAVPVWKWVPKQRYLNQEFCEFDAKRLRREGVEAICQYVDD